MSSPWKDASRTAWRTNGVSDPQLNDEHLKIGCLQRIADATELMAKNYASLVADRDNYQRWYREEKAHREGLQRQIGALRGLITKLKKKTATLREVA